MTTLILLGRDVGARAKRRAGAALKALLDLGAKDVAVLGDDGREQRRSPRAGVAGDAVTVGPAPGVERPEAVHTL